MHGRGDGLHGGGACMVREVCIAGACMVGACMVGACMAGEMSIAADGMHPTGMLSC